MSWLTRFKGPWEPLGSLRRMAFLEQLGLGRQVDVRLARDRLLSRLVTVKKSDTADAASQGTLRSLQARVDVAHPAIPTVFAVIPDGRKTWLVGEFVKGLPLSELVDELSPESIYLIARDLLSTLGCLERLGLVHGDYRQTVWLSTLTVRCDCWILNPVVGWASHCRTAQKLVSQRQSGTPVG